MKRSLVIVTIFAMLLVGCSNDSSKGNASSINENLKTSYDYYDKLLREAGYDCYDEYGPLYLGEELDMYRLVYKIAKTDENGNYEEWRITLDFKDDSERIIEGVRIIYENGATKKYIYKKLIDGGIFTFYTDEIHSTQFQCEYSLKDKAFINQDSHTCTEVDLENNVSDLEMLDEELKRIGIYEIDF